MTVQSRDKENDFIFAILDVVIGRLRVDVDGYERWTWEARTFWYRYVDIKASCCLSCVGVTKLPNPISIKSLIMFILKTLSIFGLLASSTTAAFTVPNDDQDMTGLTVNSIPYSTRVKYMRLVSFLRLYRCTVTDRWPRQTKLSMSRVDLVPLQHMELSLSITQQMQ